MIHSRWILTFSLAGLLLTSCEKQDEKQGGLVGYVKDAQTNEPVDSALVSLVKSTTKLQQTYTDSTGYFSFEGEDNFGELSVEISKAPEYRRKTHALHRGLGDNYPLPPTGFLKINTSFKDTAARGWFLQIGINKETEAQRLYQINESDSISTLVLPAEGGREHRLYVEVLVYYKNTNFADTTDIYIPYRDTVTYSIDYP